jgi:hypothetical protein
MAYLATALSTPSILTATSMKVFDSGFSSFQSAPFFVYETSVTVDDASTLTLDLGALFIRCTSIHFALIEARLSRGFLLKRTESGGSDARPRVGQLE